MDLKKNVKFKIGSEDWEMPLGVLLMLIAVALILMILGAYLGFTFGERQFSSSSLPTLESIVAKTAEHFAGNIQA
ncbi:hypothetical protein [Fontibacter flavus]|uniref:Flagellin N-terminal-like domain-containing protein n=1 Tax=Fontibacter flavus TaxID=654838 RepID=A0ABV6FRN3_9BACT